MITVDAVKDWLDKFDGDSEISLLTSIVNNEIKIPEMIDSIHAYQIGEPEIAEEFYTIMWK